NRGDRVGGDRARLLRRYHRRGGGHPGPRPDRGILRPGGAAMSARVEFEQQLARLNAVWADPDAPGATAELQSALSARSNLLVARAAEIIGELGREEFVPALVSAFDRFLIDSVRRDPTCAAKIAVAEALNKLE